MKLEVDIRQWHIKCHAEAAVQRVIDMYGTDDCFRIGEMRKSGELTIWLMGRFGTTDFSQIDKLLKSVEFGENKKVGYDDDQYNESASLSDYNRVLRQCRVNRPCAQ